MTKWILALLLAICGCAGQQTRITLTRVNGEPSISIEFQDKGRFDHANRK